MWEYVVGVGIGLDIGVWIGIVFGIMYVYGYVYDLVYGGVVVGGVFQFWYVLCYWCGWIKFVVGYQYGGQCVDK